MPRPTGYLRLWNTSDDPWSTTTSSSTLLNELSSYWNTNMRAQKRTVVYMARWAALCVADSMATPAVQQVPAVEAGPLASTADSGVFIGGSMDRPLVPSWCPAEPPLQMLGSLGCVSACPSSPRSGKSLGGGVAWWVALAGCLCFNDALAMLLMRAWCVWTGMLGPSGMFCPSEKHPPRRHGPGCMLQCALPQLLLPLLYHPPFHLVVPASLHQDVWGDRQPAVDHSVQRADVPRQQRRLL